MTEKQLLAALVYIQCTTGGGGGGGSSVDCGAGAPVAAPVGVCGLYIDTNTGTLYSYYSGAWH